MLMTESGHINFRRYFIFSLQLLAAQEPAADPSLSTYLYVKRGLSIADDTDLAGMRYAENPQLARHGRQCRRIACSVATGC